MISHEDRIRVTYMNPYRRMRIGYRVVGENTNGVFPGTWFLYNVDPVPEYDALRVVASDMKEGIKGYVCIDNGLIVPKKNFKGHAGIDEDLAEVIKDLAPKTYTIAIWLGNEIHKLPENMKGYPVVLVLNEEISRFAYPGHSFLNETFESDNYMMPESLCLLCHTEGREAGRNIVGTIEETIHWTSGWLLRQRIYEATNGLWLSKSKGRTIEPEYMEELEKNKKRYRKLMKDIRKKLDEGEKKPYFIETLR